MTTRVKKIAAGVARKGIHTAQENVLSVGRTAWLAGLGLLATAGEVGASTFESLVEKGRRRRESPLEKAQRALAAGGAETAKLAENVGRAAIRQASGLFGRLGVPSQSDIRALRTSVDATVRSLRSRLG